VITNWRQVVDFINSKEIGYVFTRKELHSSLPTLYASTIDTCRLLLCKARFLQWVGRGRYKLIAHAPGGLTMFECHLLVKRDNLSYIESIQRRKDMKAKKLNRERKCQSCDCPLYCMFDGARLRRDYVGHYCPTDNCQWRYGIDNCISRKSKML
jgi:hypothetical protein